MRENKQAWGVEMRTDFFFYKIKIFLLYTRYKGVNFHILKNKQAGGVGMRNELLMTKFLILYILHLAQKIFSGKKPIHNSIIT